MADKPLMVGDADSAVIIGAGNRAAPAVDRWGNGRANGRTNGPSSTEPPTGSPGAPSTQTDRARSTEARGEQPAAPPDVRPGSSSSAPGGRRDDVQGLRALAVILVVLYHADRILSGGYIGVDVFFVISGFVIMAMLLRELGSRGSIDMGRFYSRRVRRLLPALTVMLTATAALSALILSPLGAQQTAAETGRAAGLFAANAQLYLSPTGYFDGAAELNPLLHTWSLAVEEQFYLLFPIMLFAAWRIGRRAPRAAALLVLVTIGVVSFAGSVLLVDAGEQQSLLSQPRQFGFYASPTRAWEFVAGALLAFVVEHFRRVPAMVGRLLSITGLAIIAWCSIAYSDFTPFPGIAAVPPVLATVFLIVGGGVTTGGITAALSGRLPVRLGDLSYSWYLWHWPAIVFASVLLPGRTVAVVAGFASLAVAWLSYVFVEEWFRHDDRWKGWWSVGLAVGCIALPVVAMGALQAGSDRLWGVDAIDEVAVYNRLHGDVVRGCDETQGVAWEAERCTWSVEGSPSERPTILLLGDSHAGHLTEAVTGAGTDLGYDVVVRTRSACPFVKTELAYADGPSGDACRSHVDDAVRQAIDTRPHAVVISTAIREYLTDGSIVLGPDAELFNRSDADRTRAWREGFEPVLADLDGAGLNVLVVQPLPVFEDWSLLRCPMPTVATDPADCGATAHRDELLAARAPFAESNQRSADRFAAVDTVDLFDGLCPTDMCATNVGITFAYRDGDHLTVERSATLASEFTVALRAVGGDRGPAG